MAVEKVMAAHKLYDTIELVPLLAERGIVLSELVGPPASDHDPERLSLPVLSSLCEIFEVTPMDLIVTEAVNNGVRKITTRG